MKREYRNKIKQEKQNLLGGGDICPRHCPKQLNNKLPPENRDRERDRERDRDKDNNKSLLLFFEELGFGSINPIILEDINY